MMDKAQLQLERIKNQIATFPPEQRAEVAKLLQQIQAVVKTASDTRIASATISLFSAIAIAAMVSAKQPN